MNCEKDKGYSVVLKLNTDYTLLHTPDKYIEIRKTFYIDIVRKGSPVKKF